MTSMINSKFAINHKSFKKGYEFRSNSVSNDVRQEILNLTNSGLDILNFIFKSMSSKLEIGKNIHNPFYQDKNPSLIINFINGSYIFNDFGNPKYKGDVFDFVGFYYGKNPKTEFNEILSSINADLHLGIKSFINPKYHEPIISYKNYNREELSYWMSYGIYEELLKRFNIHSVDWFLLKNNGKINKIRNHNQLIFAYSLSDNSHKIYQPNNIKYKFCWVGKKPKNYTFGFDKLDYTKETVIIAAGEKDALSFISLGYNSIAFSSETSNIDDGIISLLKDSFDRVLICYDNDETGKRESMKIANKYRISRLDIDYVLSDSPNCKDISDYMKSQLSSKEIPDFSRLKGAISHAESVYLAIQKNLPSPFPLKLYYLLPDKIMQVLNKYHSYPEKDMMLLSIIAMISGLLPNYYTLYDGRTYESNLFLFVIGNSASGKGLMIDVKSIGLKIHKRLIGDSNRIKLSDAQLLFVPGNSSYSSFLTILCSNKGRALLIETEGDIFNDNNKQEWGNYSSALRQAFHHEPITLSRKTDDTYLDINKPKITCIISGTKEQFKKYFSDPENGFYSRFINYNFYNNAMWRNVFSDEIKEDYFSELSNWAEEIYFKLIDSKLQFQLSMNQKEEFNNKCRHIYHNSISVDSTGYLDGITKRLGLILTRIAMILSILELEEIDGKEIITCSSNTFLCINILFEILLEHSYHSMIMMPEVSKKTNINLKQPALLHQCLSDFFSRADALKEGNKLGIKSDYIDKILRNKNLFTKVGRGIYKKINRGG